MSTPSSPSGNGCDARRKKRRQQIDLDTHHSVTDPEAKLVRKSSGQEARLSFGAHATMENRNGLCVLFDVKPAVGAPEAKVAVAQV